MKKIKLVGIAVVGGLQKFCNKGAPEHKSVCGSKLVLGAKGGVVEGEKVSAWGAPDGAGPWKCTLHW